MSYMTETEQIELIKKWWQDYGVAAIIGVLITIISGFGWHYWQQKREQVLVHASMRYEELLTNIVNGESAAAEVRADRLMGRYPHTPYAQHAALQLARADVYQNKLADAEDKLRWLTKHGENKTLRAIARIRAARVLAAQNKPQDALALLDKNDNKAYTAAVEEAKGDIFAAQGHDEAARQAYLNALKSFPSMEEAQPLLKIKLDNLAIANPIEKK